MTFFGILILIYGAALIVSFTNPDENDTLAIIIIGKGLINIASSIASVLDVVDY